MLKKIDDRGGGYAERLRRREGRWEENNFYFFIKVILKK